MGIFHDTLKDAKKLFDKNPKATIRILRKHRKDALNISAGIDSCLADYDDGLGEICIALEKNNINYANMWLRGQRKTLRALKRQLEKLKKALD